MASKLKRRIPIIFSATGMIMAGGAAVLAVGRRLLPGVGAAAGVAGSAVVGSSFTQSPGEANTWTSLSVAAHSRYTLYHFGQDYERNNDINDTIDPTIWDNAPLMPNITRVPSKEWGETRVNGDGSVYLFAGAHTDYQLSDVDKTTVTSSGSTLTWSQLTKPRIPPQNWTNPVGGQVFGSDGDYYSSGGSERVYKQYAAALSSGTTPGVWEPYTAHLYTNYSWMPQYGYLVMQRYPTAWANGFPVTTTYPGTDGRHKGLTRLNESNSNRWELLAAGPQANNITSLSDFCPAINGILGFSNASGQYQVYQYTAGGSWSFVRNLNYSSGSATGPGDHEGIIIRHLYDQKFLVVAKVYATSTVHCFVWDLESPATNPTNITLPPGTAAAGGNSIHNLSFSVDKYGRRVFAAVLTASQVRVYYCTTDNLGTWTEITQTNPFVAGYGQNTSYNRACLNYYSNALYFFDKSGDNTSARRMLVETGLPSFTFTKTAVTYAGQSGFNLAGGGSKHANLEIRNDVVYYQGGDLTDSYNQEMFTYTPASNTWAQIQYKCGRVAADPTKNADGTPYIQPVQPDDGGWYWDSTIGKFWWIPGGGQSGQGISARCVDSPVGLTEAQINATTRWRVYHVLTYSPTTGRWEDVHSTFTEQSYGYPFPIWHGGETSRGQAWDSSTRTAFKFTNDPSGLSLVAIDTVNRTVKAYSARAFADGSDWSGSPATAVYDGLKYSHQSNVVNPADGKLYGVVPKTGQFFYIDTRATPLAYGDPGVTKLPMYSLGFMPVVPAPGNTSAGDHAIMRIFRGGLLYVMFSQGSIDGIPTGAWWRSLTNVVNSPWLPVQFPADFMANAWSRSAMSDGSYIAIGSQLDYQRYIWRIS
jgi:hypothetical protein